MDAPDAADKDETWDARILRHIASGVDETLIAERLKLTPTERVESMRQALLFAEEARRATCQTAPASRFVCVAQTNEADDGRQDDRRITP